LFVLPSANEKRKAGTQDYNFTFFVGFGLKLRNKIHAAQSQHCLFYEIPARTSCVAVK
jgi:hypothetical protein